MERDSTLHLIHDALSRIHDLPLMRSHPLLDAPGLRPMHGTDNLRQLLLDAVEELRPLPTTPPHSARWRQYHYLRLRYLEGESLDQVQAFIGVGDRQARRDHRDALDAIAHVLEPPPSSATGDNAPTGGENWSLLGDEIDSISVEAPPDSVDLIAAVNDAVGMVAGLATAHRVVIRRVDLTSGGASFRAFASPAVLRQLLLSMLGYLIAFDPSVRSLTLHLDFDRPRNVTTLRAIAETDEYSTETPPVDVATALAAARKLAESQGGALMINPIPGIGLGVALTLPASRPTVVLVVDDNPDVVRLFRRYCQGTDFRLTQARNGLAALDLARTLIPEVITLDLMMPLQDGWDLLAQLKTDSRTAAIPIVACSVLPERDLALSLGADSFLDKPVTREALLATLAPHRRASAKGHPGSL